MTIVMIPTDEAIAVAVVQRQVDAFNAKDIVAFADCYSESARIYRPLISDEPVLKGRAQMITSYGPVMMDDPSSRVEVVSRHYHDGLVFDVEHFISTGRRVTLGFEVLDGVITRSWVFAGSDVKGRPGAW